MEIKLEYLSYAIEDLQKENSSLDSLIGEFLDELEKKWYLSIF